MITRFHDQHPLSADLVLVLILAVLIWGAVYCNVVQFWITDLRTSLSTGHVGR